MRRIQNQRARLAMAGVVAVATIGLYAGAAEAINRRLYVHLNVPNPACNTDDPRGSVVAFGEINTTVGHSQVTTLGSTASTAIISQHPNTGGYMVGLIRVDPVTQAYSLGNSLCAQIVTNFNFSVTCNALISAHGSCAAQTMTVWGFPASG